MKRSRGAVTIFLVIVLFTTTLLGGLFIDASRILLAKRYVRNALNSSARSALSYYDTHMSSEYGLFGVDQDKAQAQFKRYFQTNLALSRNDGFDILRMEVQDQDITVTVSGQLWEDGTMLESMEDYSKYRTVVNTSVGVLNKLKGMFGGDSAAQRTFNAADTGKSALERLKSDVTRLSNEARNLISTGISTQAERARNSVSNLLRQGQTVPEDAKGFDGMEQNIRDAKTASQGIDTARDTFDEVNRAEAEKLNGVSAGSGEYWDEASGSWKTETASSTASGGQRDDIPSASNSASQEKQNVDSLISGTESRLAAKKQQINQKIAQAEACNQEIARLKAAADAATAQKNLASARVKQLEENKLKDRFNFILGDDPDDTAKELQLKLELLQSELELLRAQNASAQEIQAKEQEVNEAGQALEDYLKDTTGAAKTVYDDEIAAAKESLQLAKDAETAAKKALKDETDKRDKLIDEINALYKEIAAADSSAPSLKVPDSVSGKDKANVNENIGDFVTGMIQAFQSATSEFGKVASSVSGSAYQEFSFGLDDALEGAWDTIDRLLLTGKSLVTLVTEPERAGESMLLTDYVFSNFSFLTSQTSRDSRHFKVGEIEYILNGSTRGGSAYDSQAACITKTVMDIAMLRLGINWVDYMCTSTCPEIVSRMLIALGEAAVQTIRDMFQLIFTTDGSTSASCALCPSFDKLRLTYSDHLRLAMLIEGMDARARSGMMDRIQLMMSDTYTAQGWGDPQTLQTRIHGEVTVEVDLVMLTLPMFESVLPEDNPILQNGRFLVHETVDMGY
ncbi:MAG: hypothetical protein ACI4O6_11065 [Dysosmobacter sp.]|nr:hypothetical protein [Dysosmobacter sp.]